MNKLKAINVLLSGICIGIMLYASIEEFSFLIIAGIVSFSVVGVLWILTIKK